jgi:hypothetical protein
LIADLDSHHLVPCFILHSTSARITNLPMNLPLINERSISSAESFESSWRVTVVTVVKGNLTNYATSVMRHSASQGICMTRKKERKCGMAQRLTTHRKDKETEDVNDDDDSSVNFRK